MGVAPATTEPGDAVCILFGSRTPMILRKSGEGWRFAGQTYIHGIMDGEAFDGQDMKKDASLFQII